MYDAVGTADKFLLGFFGYLIYHYACDFCKTMIWDNEKENKYESIVRTIDKSLLTIEVNISEMNDKLTDIQEKVTLLEENTLFHIPPNMKYTHTQECENGDLD